MGGLYKTSNIIGGLFEGPFALVRLEVVPECVGEDGVDAHCAGEMESAAPEGIWDSLRVHLAADNDEWFVVQEEMGAVVCECVRVEDGGFRGGRGL